MTQPGFMIFQFNNEHKKMKQFSDLWVRFVQQLRSTHIQEVVSSIIGQETG
jgi:hypothetical protein